jgi:hypothetical protein
LHNFPYEQTFFHRGFCDMASGIEDLQMLRLIRHFRS